VELGSVGLNYKEYYEQKGLARPYDAIVRFAHFWGQINNFI
jgi:hypothetical protein